MVPLGEARAVAISELRGPDTEGPSYTCDDNDGTFCWTLNARRSPSGPRSLDVRSSAAGDRPPVRFINGDIAPVTLEKHDNSQV